MKRWNMKKICLLSFCLVASCSGYSDAVLNEPTFQEALDLFFKESPLAASHEGNIQRLRLAYFSLPKVPPMTGVLPVSISGNFKLDYWVKNNSFLYSVYHNHSFVTLRDQSKKIDNASMSMKFFLENQAPKKTSIVLTDKEAVIILGVLTAVTVTVVGLVSYGIYKWIKNKKAQQGKE